MKEHEKKLKYVAPQLIGVENIELEQGIAAGSVRPTAEDGSASQEWQTGNDASGDSNW
ncbi:hypothetical protein OHD16_15560 [Sphingobacterium sp. ML3W]|uniref:hypothetical protein n=1 Tax=Sphingobacterium sp. ML3W TaxID=1538644 RepID=UPI00249A6F57|nr:hypothetical protein [Sphingobacterium sp. ML3W]WFA81371.1 hypothetical protein OGI71_08700 [Sphingobacterium sp. ML3W]